jgi:myxalamid-type polyketide synthase MxaE and MxaD
LWGVGGLAHYAAANQALDLIAQWRHERGLRALSVNWGAWQEMRLASEADKDLFERAGLRAMPNAQALEALERLISTHRASSVVASIDWNTLPVVYEARRARPLFSEMRSHPQNEGGFPSRNSADAKSELSLQLKNAPPARRRDVLNAHLRSQVGTILGYDRSREIELEQGLFDMGMDSLMAMELRGQLQRSLAVPLPSTLTFNYPTIKALVDYLLSDAFEFDSAIPQEIAPPPPAAAIDPPVTAASDDLTEEELSELLLKKLEELEE